MLRRATEAGRLCSCALRATASVSFASCAGPMPLAVVRARADARAAFEGSPVRRAAVFRGFLIHPRLPIARRSAAKDLGSQHFPRLDERQAKGCTGAHDETRSCTSHLPRAPTGPAMPASAERAPSLQHGLASHEQHYRYRDDRTSSVRARVGSKRPRLRPRPPPACACVAVVASPSCLGPVAARCCAGERPSASAHLHSPPCSSVQVVRAQPASVSRHAQIHRLARLPKPPSAPRQGIM